MGMLLGDWIVSKHLLVTFLASFVQTVVDLNHVSQQDLPDGISSVAHVESISILTRSDKRKDRVEIAPEQLHLAAIHAEVWFNSHPS